MYGGPKPEAITLSNTLDIHFFIRHATIVGGDLSHKPSLFQV